MRNQKTISGKISRDAALEAIIVAGTHECVSWDGTKEANQAGQMTRWARQSQAGLGVPRL